MRESHLGSKLSEEQRRKMSEKRRGEKHWCYGSKRPLETRRKISEAQKGRKPWCAGKNLSEEHKTKISLAHTGMKPSPDTISKWKKSNESIMAPVEQIDVKTNEVIKRFDSLGDASRMTGVDSSSITKCCRGKRATAGGFVWRYITAG